MMSTLGNRLRSFRADARGSVAIITVLSAGVIFGMAAVTIDVSRFYLLKRQQQMAGDLAAVAAAASIGNAQAAALASLAANGRSANDLVSVELGTYTADPALAASQRFAVGTGTITNAARVTLRTTASSFFGALLSPVSPAVAATTPPSPTGGASQTTGAVIVTRSVAANQNTVSFAVGSRLASLDGGLANAILGGIIGTGVSLSVLDYQGLASANVDVFGFANALALRIGARNATYGSLATMTVRLADVLSAAADAGSTAGLPASSVQALRTLALAAGPSGPTFTLGNLVSFAAYGGLAVGSSAPISANLPLLPFVTAAARLGGSAHEVVANTSVAPPGILAVNLKLSVGSSPIGSSFASVGPVGTSLHTAQTRVLLGLQLSGLGSIAGLNLPLYVEVAPATARVAAVSCTSGVPVDPPVTLGVTPGVVDGWIGSVSDADFINMTTKPAPGAATLTNVLSMQVIGRAHATISNLSETPVSFSLANISAGTMKTTATTDYTSSLLSQLFGSLQLTAVISGASVSLPPATMSAIAQILQADLQPIDTELSNTFALLGLTIGDADTWVAGVRCGQGVLVN